MMTDTPPARAVLKRNSESSAGGFVALNWRSRVWRETVPRAYETSESLGPPNGTLGRFKVLLIGTRDRGSDRRMIRTSLFSIGLPVFRAPWRLAE
jgi:hypothetical protein